MRKGGHVRLTGEECDDQDKIIAGKTYQVRYLGSSDIQNKSGKGKGCTNEAIREIYSRYSTKSTVKSLEKRELYVSANCVSLYAPVEHAVIFRFKTVNITFCNTSDENRNAFAFVVNGAPTNPFRAHVIHCESPAQANDICSAMHVAFTVRSALFDAKRVDRAGWSNGLLSSQEQKEKIQVNGEPRVTQNGFYDSMAQNGFKNEMDSNNNFGAFACAAVLPCATDICNGSENNGNVNNTNPTRYPQRLTNGDSGERLPLTEKKMFLQNGGSFPLAKMILNGGINRTRSQSLQHEKKSAWSDAAGEWGSYQSSEEDDFDDFSLLARERSSSLKLLTTAQ